MFPKAPEEASNSLQWVEFVQATGDMGFVAHDTGGSAVSLKADGQGRIVFHKPYPEPKIVPMIL
jgi:hypothetical protein